MIFVVCRYERWCRHWFRELAERMEVSKVNDNKMKIKLPSGQTVQFVPSTRLDTYMTGRHDVDVIYWEGDDISELETKIERAA